MKVYNTTQNIDSNKNLVIITENYSNDGILKSIDTDTFDYKKDKIMSHSKNYYDDGIQLHFEIIMNYKDDYTKIKSYYESGQIKGETHTIDNIYVLHTIYNEDGTIKKEWRTELSMSE
jgi:hypothetical protein